MISGDISFTFGRLYTLLRRTKTTAATRRIKELPVCVSEKAFFEDPSWLAEGFELLRQATSETTSYPGSRATAPWRGRWLATPTRWRLRSTSWRWLGYRLWSGPIGRNSERTVLPTGLSLKPIPPADRDMLGRWKPEGSDIYMRAYGGRVASRRSTRTRPGRRTARKSWTRRRSRRGLATG